MKIRYYLRGLGLGIVFTAVFFLLSGNDSNRTMSDEMIKERAKELGMIENTVLADIGGTAEEETEILTSAEEEITTNAGEEENETTTSAEEDNSETESVEDTITEETSGEDFSEAEEVKEEETTSVEETPETPEEPAGALEAADDGRNISITVNNGDGSDTVSQKLFEAGLIKDAYEYDRYLMENGYDRRIRAGEHLIPVGAGWQEMAEILCNMR